MSVTKISTNVKVTPNNVESLYFTITNHKNETFDYYSETFEEALNYYSHDYPEPPKSVQGPFIDSNFP